MDDKIIDCMICSAMDDYTKQFRKTAIDTINKWNQINATSRRISFVPLGQGINTVPGIAESAQGVIDKQSVEKAQFGIFIFNTCSGTPTKDSKTGTLSELDSFIKANKPVHVYIRKGQELEPIKHYLKSLGTVFYETYSSKNELATKIRDLLDCTANEYSNNECQKVSVTIKNAQLAYTINPAPFSDIYNIIKQSKSGITVSQISRKTNYSKQKIYPIVRKLCDKGIIDSRQIMEPDEIGNSGKRNIWRSISEYYIP